MATLVPPLPAAAAARRSVDPRRRTRPPRSAWAGGSSAYPAQKRSKRLARSGTTGCARRSRCSPRPSSTCAAHGVPRRSGDRGARRPAGRARRRARQRGGRAAGAGAGPAERRRSAGVGGVSRASSGARCAGRPGSCGSRPWRRPCRGASARAEPLGGVLGAARRAVVGGLDPRLQLRAHGLVAHPAASRSGGCASSDS